MEMQVFSSIPKSHFLENLILIFQHHSFVSQYATKQNIATYISTGTFYETDIKPESQAKKDQTVPSSITQSLADDDHSHVIMPTFMRLGVRWGTSAGWCPCSLRGGVCPMADRACAHLRRAQPAKWVTPRQRQHLLVPGGGGADRSRDTCANRRRQKNQDMCRKCDIQSRLWIFCCPKLVELQSWLLTEKWISWLYRSASLAACCQD